MIFRQRYDLAAPRIEHARALGLPGERIEREALRLEGVVAARTGHLDRAQSVFESIVQSGDEGQRVEALDWLARIRWLRALAD